MKLKQRMTYEEMSEHMSRHSFKTPNRVNVGKYAKMKGYHVYKCMINRERLFFYINPDLPD